MGAPSSEPARRGEVVRLRQVDKLDSLHVVMIFIAVGVLAGGCLLLSASESKRLVDGARAWKEESPLRAVVQLLCLNYSAATFNPGDVKNYILGLGAGMAVLALTVSVLSRTRGEEAANSLTAASTTPGRRRLTSLGVSQILVVMFLLWSFASSRWSRAPSISAGGSGLLAIHFLWALVLGVALSPAAARLVTRVLVGILGMTAAIAVWYYYVRNPVLAAKFPFGNPSFLATCLLAGLIPAVVFTSPIVRELARHRCARKLAALLGILAALGLCLWAFLLSGSRGPAIGLGFGLFAIVFFSVRGWRKWIPVSMGACAAIVGWFYLAQAASAFSPSGRSATIRFRLAAWKIAWEMFTQKPITGHGQGGFVLTGDTHLGARVLEDPLPFTARLTHVHSEWLETLCDLGLIGLALFVGALVFAFHAGVVRIRSGADHRITISLIAVMSALVAICVEECFGVGLRVTGVPTVFFTLVGLTWALSSSPEHRLEATWSRSPRRRVATGVLGGLLGLVTVGAAQEDFSAARSAYRAGQLLAGGKMREAIDTSAEGPLRLNPVRVLSNRARLAEAHILLAEKFIARAVSRDQRSTESQPANARLAALAAEDYRLADEHARIASLELKELVSRAPRFLGSGRLEFRISLVRAHREAAQGNRSASDAFLKNAAAALERDMARLPFEPSLVTDYLRVALDGMCVKDALERLARPLRHNRLTDQYVPVLLHLNESDDVDQAMADLVAEATHAETSQPHDWVPEKLRIVAALRFLRGDAVHAIEPLREAARHYDSLATTAPLGASACYAELADALFFANILDPADAMEAAKKAVSLAPRSEPGRALRFAVEERMIQYLLAGDNEVEALALLQAHAPARASQTDIQAEHGRRIRLLLQALRDAHHATLRVNDPDSRVVQQYRKWLAHGLELNPTETGLHYLVADLAVLDRRGAAAAEALESALRLGLPLEEAARFLEAAADVLPASEELRQLRMRIDRAISQEGAPGAPPTNTINDPVGVLQEPSQAQESGQPDLTP